MKKSIIAIILTIIASMIAIFIFIINLSNKSYNNLDSDFKSANLSQNLSFNQNDYGIYLVDFENKFEILDLYYSIGYLQAKDRLWQMDYLRKKSEGKLSEILGEKFVENDKFLRKFDFENKSKIIYDNLNNENKKIIQSYTSGVNDFIKYNNDNLTFEFGFLFYKPVIWTELDCIKIYLLQYIQNNQDKDNLQSSDFSENNSNNLNNDSLNSQEYKTYFEYFKQLKSNLDNNNLSSNFTNYFQSFIPKNKKTKLKNFDTLSVTTIDKNISKNQQPSVKNTTKSILTNVSGYYSYIKYSSLELPNENYPIIIKNKNNKLIFINTTVGTPNINLINSLDNIKNFNSVIYNILDDNNNDNNDDNNDLINNSSDEFWGMCLANDKDNYILNTNNSNKIDSNKGDNKTQKIIYEIDTIKIKNSSNIQFYKKYIISNNNKFCLFDVDFNNSNNNINNLKQNSKNSQKSNESYILQYYWVESNFDFIDNYYSFVSQFINNEFTEDQINNRNYETKLNETKINQNKSNVNINIVYDSLLKFNKFIIQNSNSFQLKEEENFVHNFNLKLKQSTLKHNFLNLTNPKISDIILVQIDKNLYFDSYIFSAITNILGQPKNFLSEKEFNFFYVISKNLKNGKNNINEFVLEFKKELLNEFDTKSFKNINFNIDNNDNNVIDFNILNLISQLNNYELNNVNQISNQISNQNSNSNSNNFDVNNYKFRIAKILVKLLKKYNNNNYYNKVTTKLKHKINEKGMNNAFNSDKIELFGNYNSINYININKKYNYIYSQSQRYIYDFENKNVYFILAGGMSGDIFSPNFLDQKILWEKGGYIKLSLLYSNNLKNQFMPKFRINSF